MKKSLGITSIIAAGITMSSVTFGGGLSSTTALQSKQAIKPVVAAACELMSRTQAQVDAHTMNMLSGNVGKIDSDGRSVIQTISVGEQTEALGDAPKGPLQILENGHIVLKLSDNNSYGALGDSQVFIAKTSFKKGDHEARNDKWTVTSSFSEDSLKSAGCFSVNNDPGAIAEYDSLTGG